MTWDRIVVDLVGLGLIGFIVWFFWLVKTKGIRASLTSRGYQEQMVLVKGGYTPDVIIVERGKPVRLNFVRQESASCSEMVLFPAFNKSAKLPEGETVACGIHAQGAWRIRIRVSDGHAQRKTHCGVMLGTDLSTMESVRSNSAVTMRRLTMEESRFLKAAANGYPYVSCRLHLSVKI